ncbi:MAG TPA: hypothetical protein VMT24_10780 [Aggregatilineaceae bacterium]|nr:hypothetical protein [Aggregatilineaceae bacterium]
MSTKAVVAIIILLVVLVPMSVGAQGIPGVPSLSGGKTGGPGMGNAAGLSMPSPSVSPPTIPQPNPPSFAPPEITPPTFEPSERARPGFSPSGGGPNALAGEGGQRPRPGGEGGSPGSGPHVQVWGSGYSPFSQDQSGQWSRFGERGSGSIPLGQVKPEGTLGWFDAGGFGALSEPPEGFDPNHVQNIAPIWRPDDLPAELPPAPGAYSDIAGVTQAQANAQAALESAGDNRDQISADAQQTIQTATQNAQQAYDQFWQDYYAGVDYAAQAYYEAMTSSADAMLQTYTQAVTYTVQAVDYYLAYYDQYAAYCYYYPWDCYMYAYDLATGVYYPVGETSSAPVGYVEIGDVSGGDYPPPSSTPVPSAEAYRAVTVFANDQLGAVVQPLYAGEATSEVQAALGPLPDMMEALLLKALLVSCNDYWALLNGGFAGVLAGDCSTAQQAVTTEMLNAVLSSSAAGVYAIYADAAVPSDADGALALITKVYPALEGLAFAQITDIQDGSAFTATAAGLGTDPVTGQSLSVAKVIYAGVVEVDGKPLVYALLGVGQPYVDLLAAGQ